MGSADGLIEQNPTASSSLPPSSKPLTIIGIGASAGGLSALRDFFAALPADTGLTFVVVVHLSPEHESMLAQLLQPQTKMPVSQVSQRVKMEPNQVYIIPPAKRLFVTDSHLDIADFDEPQGQRLPIDTFFRTLADQHGDGAAVILTGTGSDGAVGIKAIKERGGLLLVQDPDQAEFDGMPRSAIATGLVDVIAPIQELANSLIRFARNKSITLRTVEVLDADELSALLQILSIVHHRTSHDFSRYKRSTLLRRINRRMQLTDSPTLDAYRVYLDRSEGEANALFRDLLIPVTEFFRDATSFRMLQQDILPDILSKKPLGQSIRVWTVGCASGEEAYSLAILLLEQTAQMHHPPEIQIFASDLGEDFLNYAREGVYPEAIATDISEERLKRFFVRENHHYRVRSEVRERVLFAAHNALQDPPFSKIDLISCRNLLIYLQRDVQEKLFELFHYALNPNGYLFLGSAESVNGVSSLFETVDKTHRMYRRIDGPVHVPTLPMSMTDGGRATPAQTVPQVRAVVQQHQRMLEEYAPPSILLDSHNRVLHLSESAGRFMQPSGGVWTNDVLRSVRPELRTELGATLQRAQRQNMPVTSRPVSVQLNGVAELIHMIARTRMTTLEEGGTPVRQTLVYFLEGALIDIDVDAPEDEASHDQIRQLQAELRYTQSQLQTMREGHEVSTEELQAANEELQSINEEYRSTLEELETSKEELQSMNEELQTMNQELKNRVAEVSQAHGDLQNLLTSTDIATLFLDRQLHIRRYTARTVQLFNLTPGDQGRPITDLRPKLDYDQLESDAQQVLEHLSGVEREVMSDEGDWYLARLRPYRTLDDRIDGVVVTFVDITSRHKMAEALAKSKEFAESIVETVKESLVVMDEDLCIQSANSAFYQTFGLSAENTEGQFIYEVNNGCWDIPELRMLLDEVLSQENVISDFQVEADFPDFGHRLMLLGARRLDHVDLILLVIQDITELDHQQTQLAEMRRRLIETQESERRTLAHDLHDGPVQELSALTYQLAAYRNKVENETEKVPLAVVGAKLERTIANLRSLTTRLRPPAVVDFGLVAAIENEVSTIAEQNPPYAISTDLAHDLPTLAEDIILALYRVLQQALYNVTHHANAQHVWIRLSYQQNLLTLEIEDDGQGFTVPDHLVKLARQRHLGIVGMAERIEGIGGKFSIKSEPGQGTLIKVELEPGTA